MQNQITRTMARSRSLARWAFALVLLFALPALALDLDEARAKGLLGEKADGYVAAVSETPSEEVAQLVAEINAKRRAAYQEIAQRTGAPVEAVGALSGKKLIEKAPSGQWVKPDGAWVKKP